MTTDKRGVSALWLQRQLGLSRYETPRGSRQLQNRRAALVPVAVEKRGKASGRVRMRVIPDFKATTMIPFLTQNVTPGSTIYTDGLKSFVGVSEAASPPFPFRSICGRRGP